jgi:adenylate cyclase
MSTPRARWLTLPRFFALAVGLLALVAGLVLALAVRAAGQAVMHTGESARAATAARVVAQVEGDLGAGERAIEDFERALALGVVDDREGESVRRYLTAALIGQRGLTELTLTSGTFASYADDGAMVLGADERWQISVFRERSGAIGARTVTSGEGPDPTEHPTFQAAANRAFRGRALWSDLAFSQLDAELPPAQRRKTMTVQKAVFARTEGADGGGGPAGEGARFAGVLRAGILGDALDRIGAERAPGDAHRIFICDDTGRLVTRLGPDDPYLVVNAEGKPDPSGDDLRVVPRETPAPIAAALALARSGARNGRTTAGGEAHLITLLPVAEGRAQDWRVGIVVPERVYVGALADARTRLLILLGLVVAAIAAVALAGARTVGRGMRALVRSTEAMHRFSFEAGAATAPFAEVQGALESVERAKTALRAMVKYVPVGLVRRLYESGREPALGAELAEVSLMFTDIADFTTHAEALGPAKLAEALGRYLETATRAVEAHGGTVDKYIGDALMVLWNAPDPVADHPRAACRAALAAAAAGAALGESIWWRDAAIPPWRTRFGLHVDRVLVGHFGAPDRLSYTAMGDGVNLAARLEGLNKVYRTTILASEEVRARTRGEEGDSFVWRQVDRVAVKGKTRAVAVYELVGEAGDAAAEARRPAIATYESALQAAFSRQFARAAALCATLPDDGPAQVLAARCRAWMVTPPPADWDGSWTATTK